MAHEDIGEWWYQLTCTFKSDEWNEIVWANNPSLVIHNIIYGIEDLEKF